jgi:hypothetical protein
MIIDTHFASESSTYIRGLELCVYCDLNNNYYRHVVIYISDHVPSEA